VVSLGLVTMSVLVPARLAPRAELRLVWTCVLVLAVIYESLTLPLELAFGSNSSGGSTEQRRTIIPPVVQVSTKKKQTMKRRNTETERKQ